MSERVHRLGLGQRLTISMGAFFFKLWARTLSLDISPLLQRYIDTPDQRLILLWHNRLALALMLFNRKAKLHRLTGLVSASRDGAILSQIMQSFRIDSARGSSSKRAMSATKELMSALQAKRSIVITPDGPRGPLYTAKKGIEAIASLAPTVVLKIRANRYWKLKSWDEFILPKPFTTITADIELLDQAADFEAINKALQGSQ